MRYENKEEAIQHLLKKLFVNGQLNRMHPGYSSICDALVINGKVFFNCNGTDDIVEFLTRFSFVKNEGTPEGLAGVIKLTLDKDGFLKSKEVRSVLNQSLENIKEKVFENEKKKQAIDDEQEALLKSLSFLSDIDMATSR